MPTVKAKPKQSRNPTAGQHFEFDVRQAHMQAVNNYSTYVTAQNLLAQNYPGRKQAPPPSYTVTKHHLKPQRVVLLKSKGTVANYKVLNSFLDRLKQDYLQHHAASAPADTAILKVEFNSEPQQDKDLQALKPKHTR